MKRLVLPDLRNTAPGYQPQPVPRTTDSAKPLGFRIVNSASASDDVTEMWLYDLIGSGGIPAQSVIDAMAEIETGTLRVRINSPGGEIFDGVAIANCLASFNGTVEVVVDSLCASIATAIAMAGDSITMSPMSQMMIHNASGICIGASPDMTQMAAMLDFQSRNIAAGYAARAGGPIQDWLDRMGAETWYSADEAVAAGLADSTGIVKQADKQVTPAAASDWMDMWDLSAVYKFAGRDKAPAPTAVHKMPVQVTPAERVAFQAKAQSKLDMRLGEIRVDAARHGLSDEQIDALIENKSKTMQWDWQTDGDATVCDICQGNADGGPYKPGDQPDCPAHPNCGCELTPIMVVAFDQAPQAPAAPASPVIPIDADLFRRTLEGAFA